MDLKEVTPEELKAALMMNKRYAIKRSPMLAEDLESAGKLAIFSKAIPSYDREKGKFLTWCRWWIQKAIIVEHKNMLTPLRLPTNEYFDVTTAAIDELEGFAAPQADTVSDLGLVVLECLEELKPKDREILNWVFIQGRPAVALAGKMGLSKQGAICRCKRARERLAAKVRERWTLGR